MPLVSRNPSYVHECTREVQRGPREDLLRTYVESPQRIFLVYILGLLQRTELFRRVRGPNQDPIPSRTDTLEQEQMVLLGDRGVLEATVRWGLLACYTRFEILAMHSMYDMYRESRKPSIGFFRQRGGELDRWRASSY